MSELRTANAVGGKTARACDSCVRRRARWYCAADDAFLCQACDASVHSANPLARRHDRVRLKTSSSSSPSRLSPESLDLDYSFPTWNLQGCKRKARTPRRHAKSNSSAADMLTKPAPLVPDLENNKTTNYGGDDEDEDAVAAAAEEELLYQVPIFDPDSDLAGFCCSPPGFDVVAHVEEEKLAPSQLGAVAVENHHHHHYHHQDHDDLTMIDPDGVNPTDAELAEFAADVENLLCEGLLEDHDSGIEGLRLLVESRDDGDHNFCRGHVKMELLDGAAVHTSTCGLMGGENGNYLMDDREYSRDQSPLGFNFDSYGSLAGGEDAQYHKLEPVDYHGYGPHSRVGLRLDYEAVIVAWSSLRGCSPWTDGERPQSNLDDCWPDFLGGSAGVEGGYGEQGLVGERQVGINGDGGREARVSRYREKRRTRLFSKKIRYEVRKLNAEKRPRMKGRFVKRAPPFPPPPPPPVAAASACVAAAAAAAAAAFPYL